MFMGRDVISHLIAATLCFVLCFVLCTVLALTKDHDAKNQTNHRLPRTKHKAQSSLQRYSDTDNSVVFLVDINLRIAAQSRRSLGDGMRTKRSSSVMAVAALHLHRRTRSWPAVLNL